MGKVKNRFGQSGHGTLKLIVFEEGTDIITDFSHVDTDSQKLQPDQIFFRWGVSKNGFRQSGHGTLKLTVSLKISRWNKLFFACWYKFRKGKS